MNRYRGNFKAIKISLFFLLLLSLFILYSFFKNKLIIHSVVSVGEVVPKFSFKNIKGEKLSISQFRGKNIYLVLLNLDCSNCIQHIEELKILKKYFLRKELKIIVIAANSINKITIFTNKNDIPFMICQDSYNIIKKIFKDKFIPVSYLLDKNLIIRSKKVGITTFYNELKYVNNFLNKSQSVLLKTRLKRFLRSDFLKRDGIVLQQQNNDCGAACLKMIFDHYGIKKSLKEISKNIIMNKGADMLSIKKFAEKESLKVNGWKMSLKDLKKARKPLIASVFNNHHYVVVYNTEKYFIILLDPARGKIIYSYNEFMKIWKGVALTFKYKERGGGAN